MALIVRVKSSVGEIVEKLSALLPADCLLHGCSQELIGELICFLLDVVQKFVIL